MNETKMESFCKYPFIISGRLSDPHFYFGMNRNKPLKILGEPINEWEIRHLRITYTSFLSNYYHYILSKLYAHVRTNMAWMGTIWGPQTFMSQARDKHLSDGGKRFRKINDLWNFCIFSEEKIWSNACPSCYVPLSPECSLIWTLFLCVYCHDVRKLGLFENIEMGFQESDLSLGWPGMDSDEMVWWLLRRVIFIFPSQLIH